MKPVIKNLILTFVVVCLVFLSGELALNIAAFLNSEKNGRGIQATKTKSLAEGVSENGSQADQILNHVHVPGLQFTYTARDGKEFETIIKYNSKGLNDKEHPYAKPAGTARIVILGDSFVEALQVPRGQNFCEIIEKRLNAGNPAEKYETINMGTSGYSPILEYVYLKREGLKYEPDVVILCFFMNDVHDDLIYKGMATFDNENLPISVSSGNADKTEKIKKTWKRAERRLCNSVKAVINRSKFYVFLKKRVYRLLEIADIRKSRPEENPYFILCKDPDPEKLALWKDTLRYILATKELAERNGVKFLLVTIPVEGQLHGTVRCAVSRFYLKEKPYSDRYEKRIKSFCSRNGIDYLSLLLEFEESRAEGFYYKRDSHFNEKGHEEAAALILKKLEKLGWV